MANQSDSDFTESKELIGLALIQILHLGGGKIEVLLLPLKRIKKKKPR